MIKSIVVFSIYVVFNNCIFSQAERAKQVMFHGKLVCQSHLEINGTGVNISSLKELERSQTNTYTFGNEGGVFALAETQGDTIYYSYCDSLTQLTHFQESNRNMDFSYLEKGKRDYDRTGKEKWINGILCEQYVVHFDDEDIFGDVWVAKDLPFVAPIDVCHDLFMRGQLIVKKSLTMRQGDIVEMIYTMILKSYEYNADQVVSLAIDMFNESELETYRPFKNEIDNFHIIPIDERKYLQGLTTFDQNDHEVDIQDFLGKYTYLSIWASWCKSCIQSISRLSNLSNEFANDGLNVISLSFDKVSERENWKDAIQQHEMTWTNLIIYEGHSSSFGTIHDVKMVPHYILVDSEGRVMMNPAPSPSNEFLMRLFDGFFGR